MTLHPFAIGTEKLGSATFVLPDDLVDADGDPLYNRPVVGMEVDGTGRIVIVAAYDPKDTVEEPDGGPFRGAVFAIGRVTDGAVERDQAFKSRDLAEYDIAYLFIDGIAERIRPRQRREPVLAGFVGIRSHRP